jgi:nickel-dependent lactate racemase
MLTPPIFIVNAILNHEKKFVRIVAGDLILAHREGVKVSSTINGEDRRASDIVITDSHPMDQDLRQW